MIGESFEEKLKQRSTVEIYQKIFFCYRQSIHVLLELRYFDIPKPFPQKKFSVSILHYKIGFK